jgi:hypothetical protein
MRPSLNAVNFCLTMVSIDHTDGYLVADVRGRSVGHVECPLYGTSPDAPDALAVRSGMFIHRHFLVPASVIDDVDERTRVVGLRLERQQLTRFL